MFDRVFDVRMSLNQFIKLQKSKFTKKLCLNFTPKLSQILSTQMNGNYDFMFINPHKLLGNNNCRHVFLPFSLTSPIFYDYFISVIYGTENAWLLFIDINFGFPWKLCFFASKFRYFINKRWRILIDFHGNCVGFVAKGNWFGFLT